MSTNTLPVHTDHTDRIALMFTIGIKYLNRDHYHGLLLLHWSHSTNTHEAVMHHHLRSPTLYGPLRALRGLRGNKTMHSLGDTRTGWCTHVHVNSCTVVAATDHYFAIALKDQFSEIAFALRLPVSIVYLRREGAVGVAAVKIEIFGSEQVRDHMAWEQAVTFPKMVTSLRSFTSLACTLVDR
jgi:hypothetical protein